jgi:hypothetical protein
LEKQYAASTAGVDHGSPGRYIPTKAMPKKIMPAVNHIAFLIFTFIFLYIVSKHSLTARMHMSIIASVCKGVGAKRNRSAPTGTVGYPIACT